MCLYASLRTRYLPSVSIQVFVTPVGFPSAFARSWSLESLLPAPEPLPDSGPETLI
jgi:hypothetical protein